MADMTISVLERISNPDPAYRKERESHYIAQFESFRKGINRKRWLFLIGTFLKIISLTACNSNLVLFVKPMDLVCYDRYLSDDAYIK